jgi:hypothetical protein
MSIQIHAVPLSAAHDLRQLVVNALGQIVEAPQLLDTELPWEGGPLLAIDARQQPVLISFDLRDATRAVFNGLAAVDKFDSNRALLARLHPKLAEPAVMRTSRLIILVGENTASIRNLAQSMPHAELLRFRVFQVHGQTGLFIEPLITRSSPARHERSADEREASRFRFQPEPEPVTVSAASQEAELSDQEETYFRSL